MAVQTVILNTQLERRPSVLEKVKSLPDHPKVNKMKFLSPALIEGANLAVCVANARILSVFLEMIWSSSSASSRAPSPLMTKLVALSRYARLASIVAIPFAIYGVASEAKRMTKDQKVDGILRIMEATSWLSQSASTFVRGLSLTGAHAVTVAADCALSFSCASVILSTATIALNVKHLRESRVFLKKIKKAEDLGVLKVQSNDNLEKYFNVEGDKLKGMIKDIDTNIRSKLNSEQPEDKAEGKSIREKALNAFKVRIKSKHLSHKLACVSAVVTLIGMAILLLSPLAPLAYTFLAIGSGIALVKFYREKKSIEIFATELNSLKTTVPVELYPFRAY